MDGQKAQKLAGQDQGGNRFLVKAGGLARHAPGLADFHIRRVVAQAGKGVAAQAGPVQRLRGFRRRARLAKQSVAWTAIQQHRLVKQPGVVQRVRTAVAGDDAQLKLPVQHATLNAVERGHVQLQRHLGRALHKQGYRLGDMAGRVAHGFVEHRHMQLAAHALVDFVHPAAKRVGGRQELAGLGVNLLAFGRERKACAPTPAQHQAQAGFQVFDMAAHRGGANIEFELRRRHAAAVRHGAKHAQQAQVHVADLAQRRAAGRGPARRVAGAGVRSG